MFFDLKLRSMEKFFGSGKELELPWSSFYDLNPGQAIRAQQLWKERKPDWIANRKLYRKVEWWLGDNGEVVGFRLVTAQEHEESKKQRLSEARSKTDLQDWKSMPLPFHINQN